MYILLTWRPHQRIRIERRLSAIRVRYDFVRGIGIDSFPTTFFTPFSKVMRQIHWKHIFYEPVVVIEIPHHTSTV